MDEQEYKDFRELLNELPCPFEKAVLSARCHCARLRRLNIAEREAAACTRAESRQRCLAFLEKLHEKSRFALRHPGTMDDLPHGKEMKVQCGGLLGLQAALAETPPPGPPQVADVDALLAGALASLGDLENLPYAAIARHISQYRVRPRRGGE